MRAIPLLTALLVALAFGLWIFGLGAGPAETAQNLPPPADAAPKDQPVSVVVRRSQAESVRDVIILRGRTEAFRKVEVMAETSGRVISRPLRSGAQVAEGDSLCRIDPGERQAALEEAQARLEDARIRNDAATKLGDYAAETTRLAARAALNSAVYAVRTAELELQRLDIRAPFDGLLETDTAELGSLLQPGALCATVIALDPIKLVGFVPESRVGRLHAGAPAGARLIDGREVTGTITFLSRSADETTRTFRVEITVPNPRWEIRDGLTAEIGIPLAPRQGHLLPQRVLTLDDRGRMGVRVAEDGVARFVPVTVIRDAPEGLWLDGLPATAEVIITGQEYVSDGRALDVSYEAAAGGPDAAAAPAPGPAPAPEASPAPPAAPDPQATPAAPVQ
ncbi:efflux RND transporter periplasmic adaptor subunit [Paroceanicella profunda]|uniref:Efflux RND transporter periplasmic adaptor subunit n=1 Tax=Paroceanicella profunda TaxID=2579971 RepID=A0A5B8G1K3_9RHOB|nr:efflux RND transporter periplasmic adaptor subunit [Paroceanicella profunda]QDL92373.1 efflux RND transporter periplasmic adaptor subunit [Paroceanicella profunda]